MGLKTEEMEVVPLLVSCKEQHPCWVEAQSNYGCTMMGREVGHNPTGSATAQQTDLS